MSDLCELYDTLCETTAELQPVLQVLAPLRAHPRVRQTCDAIERVLHRGPAQLGEYLATVDAALVPACYHLGHLSCAEARIAEAAIQKVLHFAVECRNELVDS